MTKDTAAIQAVIDDCAANGGGQVLFENSRFVFGLLRTRSNVELHLEADAVLLFTDCTGVYVEDVTLANSPSACEKPVP